MHDQPRTPRVAGRSGLGREAGITATLELIDSGRSRDQDGATFQNRGLCRSPTATTANTVETPGSDDRGARRFVIGEDGETFYTRDHYQSFISIDPEDFG